MPIERTDFESLVEKWAVVTWRGGRVDVIVISEVGADMVFFGHVRNGRAIGPMFGRELAAFDAIRPWTALDAALARPNESPA